MGRFILRAMGLGPADSGQADGQVGEESGDGRRQKCVAKGQTTTEMLYEQRELRAVWFARAGRARPGQRTSKRPGPSSNM